MSIKNSLESTVHRLQISYSKRIDKQSAISYDAKVLSKRLLNLHTKNSATSDLPKLAAPAQRALASLGIYWLDQLTQFSESEIKRLHGIGPNALSALRRALKAKRKSFAKEKK